MRAWTADELRSFTAATSCIDGLVVWALMATTGMRRGELLGLRWSDVDLTAGTVTIRATRIRYANTIAASAPKTARVSRTIAIGPVTVAALKAWKRDRRRNGCSWVPAGRTPTG